MKFFKYEKKDLWVNLADTQYRERCAKFSKILNKESGYISYDRMCLMATEMCRATCKAKHLKYRYNAWTRTLFAEPSTVEYLISIMPPAWKKLDVVTTITQ